MPMIEVSERRILVQKKLIVDSAHLYFHNVGANGYVKDRHAMSI